MHFLVSPAKTLDYERSFPTPAPTRPRFLTQSTELIEVLRTLSREDISALMDLSPALADLNHGRYADWSTRGNERTSRPAVMVFDGDVYDGLDAQSLSVDELDWAQAHVSILSGLYGLLRPLDRIHAYRLEMGTSLTNERGRNLYAYWGDTLAQHLSQQLAHESPQREGELPVVVNLASQEYFRAVQRPALKARVIECVFEDWKPAGYKIISFFAKRARGLMLRYAIQHRVSDPAQLCAFDTDGYRYESSVSDDNRLVFRRRLPG